MRKYLFLTILFCSTLVFGQNKYFELTPFGFRNATDSTKDYVVLNFPKKTKAELYKRVLVWANKNYVTGKNVVSPVENENITINAYGEYDDDMTKSFGEPNAVKYRINISFKDGKIKIDAPDFQLSIDNTKIGLICPKDILKLMTHTNEKETWCFYYEIENENKTSLVENKIKIQALSDFFNQRIDQIKQKIENKTTDDNW